MGSGDLVLYPLLLEGVLKEYGILHREDCLICKSLEESEVIIIEAILFKRIDGLNDPEELSLEEQGGTENRFCLEIF